VVQKWKYPYPWKRGSHINLRGMVVSAKRTAGNTSEQPAGMGIEFKEVREDERRILRDFIKRVSAHDVVEGRKFTMKPSFADK
jgi:hypothetical protein